MRKALILVLLVCVKGGTAGAQAPSITLGDAILQLGMSRAEVNAELAKHPPLTLDETGGISNLPLGEHLNTDDFIKRSRLYGNISFKQGRLTHIEKNWVLDNGPDTDTRFVIASALYGAVSATAGTTPKICKVSAWTNSEPEEDYKETLIECDAPGISRSVRVYIKTEHILKQEFLIVLVNEVLEIQ